MTRGLVRPPFAAVLLVLATALLAIGIVAIGVGTVSIPAGRVIALLATAFDAPWSGAFRLWASVKGQEDRRAVLAAMPEFGANVPYLWLTVTGKAVRQDAIVQACIQLPEDHGIFFPGGYYLQNALCSPFCR